MGDRKPGVNAPRRFWTSRCWIASNSFHERKAA